MTESLIANPPQSLRRLDLRRGIVLSGAAELMFFFGAPLAHVVAYEEWQREQHLRHRYRRCSRARLAPPPLIAGAAK